MNLGGDRGSAAEQPAEGGTQPPATPSPSLQQLIEQTLRYQSTVVELIPRLSQAISLLGEIHTNFSLLQQATEPLFSSRTPTIPTASRARNIPPLSSSPFTAISGEHVTPLPPATHNPFAYPRLSPGHPTSEPLINRRAFGEGDDNSLLAPRAKRLRTHPPDALAQPAHLFRIDPAILLDIIDRLDDRSAAALSRTCRQLNQLVSSSPVWDHFSQQLWPPGRLRGASVGGLRLDDVSTMRQYGLRVRLEANWSQGRCTETYLKGLSHRVVCLQFENNRVLAADAERLMEWDIARGTIADSFISPSSIIRFGFNEQRMVMSTEEGVRVYDAQTKEYLYRMPETFSPVMCFRFDRERMVAGSWDGYIFIYSMPNGQIRSTLQGHNLPIYSIDYNSTAICTGSSDKTIRLWALVGTGTTPLNSFRGHSKTVTCLQMDEQVVLSGSKDATVRMFDIRSQKCLQVFEGHSKEVTQLQASGFRLVTASRDGTVRITDLRTPGRGEVTITSQVPVQCAQFDLEKIVAAGEDGMVRVTSFSSDLQRFA